MLHGTTDKLVVFPVCEHAKRRELAGSFIHIFHGVYVLQGSLATSNMGMPNIGHMMVTTCIFTNELQEKNRGGGEGGEDSGGLLVATPPKVLDVYDQGRRGI